MMQRKEKVRDNIGIHITTAFPLLKKYTIITRSFQ